MPIYRVGSSLVLVAAGTEIDVDDVVSTPVEDDVVVVIVVVVIVVVEVMSSNPNLDRKCQFHIVGGV